jgi:hypothetical protein
MTSAFLFVIALGLAAALVVLWRNTRLAARAEAIRTYPLPRGLYDKLREKFPHLTLKDCQLVGHGLRHFFLAHLKSGRKFVSMPSVVADELWHEFILHTKSYEQFCMQAFGRFMHHTPAVVLGSASLSNAGLRRCWWYACREEHIDPRKPTRLPLLFALDAKLEIPGGFRYVPDCNRLRGEDAAGSPVVYCGGDFASAGIDGGAEGFDDASGAEGGDGGSGCGGGCGGGGD